MSDSSPISIGGNVQFGRSSELLLSLALLAVLVVLLVPLPPVLLDMLLALNLGITVLLLLVTLSARQPLDISVFPSLLLLLTLFRLSLNVATTRLILLDGDAGNIVSTFGGFVVGGNLIVGLVVFSILIIIQFIVITKGSGRISEVSARFTLDALPGKQMAIDAELNAGAIDDVQARERRLQLTREAEFYGAMDGASKFVRGDAIAGLIITVVNLLGGVILGLTNGMSIIQAIESYSVLTVGDGLVSQIPALIIATTSGILVTKAASDVSLGEEIGTQILSNHRPLWIGAFIMVVIAMTPGLPKLPFALFAIGLAIMVRKLRAKERQQKQAKPSQPETDENAAGEDEPLNDFLQTDRAGIEIGARLIPLLQTRTGKSLPSRITGLRRELTRQHGLWVPMIRIRDNIELGANEYRFLINGREVARGEIHPDEYLAINSDGSEMPVPGTDAVEPAFGLPARWISPNDRQRAELAGFTVVDAASVLITHLSEMLRLYAHELLSREDLQKLLEQARTTAPTVVDELKPEVIRMGQLHQVLLQLLKERVPISNLAVILEATINRASQSKDAMEIAELIRDDIGRDICDRYRDEQGRVRVVVLDPRLELKFRECLRDGDLALPPAQLERLIEQLSAQKQKASVQEFELAVLSDRALRRPLRRSIERALGDLGVIAYSEIPSDLMIEPVAMIGMDDIFSRNDAPMNTEETSRQLEERLLPSGAGAV